MAKNIVFLLSLVLTAGCDQLKNGGIPNVYAICTWTVYNHNHESFVINLEDKSVLWVEEEKNYGIEVLEEGYIMFMLTNLV